MTQFKRFVKRCFWIPIATLGTIKIHHLLVTQRKITGDFFILRGIFTDDDCPYECHIIENAHIKSLFQSKYPIQCGCGDGVKFRNVYFSVYEP
jgi:hypothetical protein